MFHVTSRSGSLRAGDAVVVGAQHGKVRLLLGADGAPLQAAAGSASASAAGGGGRKKKKGAASAPGLRPSQPARVLGLKGMPEARALFLITIAPRVAP